VAEQLDICGAQASKIPKLPSGDVYFGPPLDEADPCKCSSIYYSLLAACSACQDREWIPWSTYTNNCSQVFLTTYPNTVPNTTRVPHWAYLNVSNNDTFNVAAASSVGGPETTHPPIPSSTGSSAHSSHSSSRVGVIAGSTVGGSLGLALISALLFSLYRRRRSRSSRIKSRLNAADGPGVLATPQSSTWNLGPSASQSEPQKVYDSPDFATFPPELGSMANSPLTYSNSVTSQGKTYYYPAVAEV